MVDEAVPAQQRTTERRGERRWPMAVATLAAAAMHPLLPAAFRVGPPGLYPAFVVGLLVVLVVGDPGRIDRRRPWLRTTTGLMIGLMTLVNTIAAGRLVVAILTKSSFATARQLLTIGAIIWATNVIAFALWFWDLDGGGAAARASGSSGITPALVFPEMTMPEFVGGDWFPQFVDYLALSFNTATAFSPTDVAAVKPWAKLMMIVESVVSLTLFALVIARAINIL